MEILIEDMEEDEEEISEKEVPGGGGVGQEAAEKCKEEAKKSGWATKGFTWDPSRSSFPNVLPPPSALDNALFQSQTVSKSPFCPFIGRDYLFAVLGTLTVAGLQNGRVHNEGWESGRG